ncbi:hypothetical protein ERJ75_001641500 [Trypanosoma vivax]|nr:hypothetical protein ERJ75_001810800 [Trypanosoma vivax]KAH8605197.1 hypothetical protein ERJ75_001641500 [Trypanosoma vivax]
MLDVAPLRAVVLLPIAAVNVTGMVAISGGGFLHTAFGALVVALFLSMLVCMCVVWLLEVSGGAAQELIPVALLRAVLASVAQPTVGSLALLAVLVVVSSGASQMCVLVEDVQILLDSRIAFSDASAAATVR